MGGEESLEEAEPQGQGQPEDRTVEQGDGEVPRRPEQDPDEKERQELNELVRKFRKAFDDVAGLLNIRAPIQEARRAAREAFRAACEAEASAESADRAASTADAAGDADAARGHRRAADRHRKAAGEHRKNVRKHRATARGLEDEVWRLLCKG